MACPLLKLSRELRDLVYHEVVIEDDDFIPVCNPANSQFDHPDNDEPSDICPFIDNPYRFQQLGRVNRQMRQEVMEVAGRIRGRWVIIQHNMARLHSILAGSTYRHFSTRAMFAPSFQPKYPVLLMQVESRHHLEGSEEPRFEFVVTVTDLLLTLALINHVFGEIHSVEGHDRLQVITFFPCLNSSWRPTPHIDLDLATEMLGHFRVFAPLVAECAISLEFSTGDPQHLHERWLNDEVSRLNITPRVTCSRRSYFYRIRDLCHDNIAAVNTANPRSVTEVVAIIRTYTVLQRIFYNWAAAVSPRWVQLLNPLRGQIAMCLSHNYEQLKDADMQGKWDNWATDLVASDPFDCHGEVDFSRGYYASALTIVMDCRGGGYGFTRILNQAYFDHNLDDMARSILDYSASRPEHLRPSCFGACEELLSQPHSRRFRDSLQDGTAGIDLEGLLRYYQLRMARTIKRAKSQDRRWNLMKARHTKATMRATLKGFPLPPPMVPKFSMRVPPIRQFPNWPRVR